LDPVFPVVMTLPYWSSIVTPTETVPPAVMDPAGCDEITSLLGGPVVMTNGLVDAVVIAVCVVSLAAIVYEPGAVMESPLKLATPLVAASEVVPVAKLPDESVSLTVSVDPMFPVVIGLPYWSSTVTPTEKVPPVTTEAGGWVVTASWLSAAGVMVNPLVVPLTEAPLTVANAVRVGVPVEVSA
jgi:hypothetical protein